MLSAITSPTLLLNKTICLQNIERMANKAKRHNVQFRPHFKTHFSAEIGNWFREYGVKAITCSSLKMAQYFAQHAWQDITVAFPANVRETPIINELASKITLNLPVLYPETVTQLDALLQHEIGIFLKIDTGYGRTGILWTDLEKIETLLKTLKAAKHLQFKGFLAHAGHSYKVSTHPEIIAIHEDCLQKMKDLKAHFSPKWGDILISIGDTPGCSVAENFEGADELRPGNLVFYDLMQCGISACTVEQIAVCLACPVVAKHRDRLQIITHGGAVHLSKDFLKNEEGIMHYGKVVQLRDDGWSGIVEGMFVKSLSQEHGIIQATPETFDLFEVGDLLGVLPVHSCLTANLMREYVTLEGEQISCMPQSS